MMDMQTELRFLDDVYRGSLGDQAALQRAADHVDALARRKRFRLIKGASRINEQSETSV